MPRVGFETNMSMIAWRISSAASTSTSAGMSQWTATNCSTLTTRLHSETHPFRWHSGKFSFSHPMRVRPSLVTGSRQLKMGGSVLQQRDAERRLRLHDLAKKLDAPVTKQMTIVKIVAAVLRDVLALTPPSPLVKDAGGRSWREESSG